MLIGVVKALVETFVGIVESQIHVVETPVDMSEVLLQMRRIQIHALLKTEKTLVHGVFQMRKPLVYAQNVLVEMFLADKLVSHVICSSGSRGMDRKQTPCNCEMKNQTTCANRRANSCGEAPAAAASLPSTSGCCRSAFSSRVM